MSLYHHFKHDLLNYRLSLHMLNFYPSGFEPNVPFIATKLNLHSITNT